MQRGAGSFGNEHEKNASLLRDKKNKARLFSDGPCYMDGLVSTGIKIPYTILKIIFSNTKIFGNFFINNLPGFVDKGRAVTRNKNRDQHRVTIINVKIYV